MDDDDEEIASLHDVNRAFLQTFLARGTLTFAESRPIIAAIFNARLYHEASREGVPPPSGDDLTTEDQISPEDFDMLVARASGALSRFDYEIRSAVHQVTGERVYAVVNTTVDEATRGASSRTTPEQRLFLRRVLDAIFVTNNTNRREAVCISRDDALRLCRPARRRQSQGASQARGKKDRDKGLTKTEAERVLADLVAEGWLELSRAGYYAPAPRFLLELKGWLVERYNKPAADDDSDDDDDAQVWKHIKFCAACREIVTRGIRCDNVDCAVRLHTACVRPFWRMQAATPARGDGSRSASPHPRAASVVPPGDRRCPTCEAPWSGGKFVGEWVDTAGVFARRGAKGAQRRSAGSQLLQQQSRRSSARHPDDSLAPRRAAAHAILNARHGKAARGSQARERIRSTIAQGGRPPRNALAGGSSAASRAGSGLARSSAAEGGGASTASPGRAGGSRRSDGKGKEPVRRQRASGVGV